MFKYIQVSSGSDEEYVDHLCDRVEKSINEGYLPIDIFNDDAVFRAEMERIYTRNWIFIAHETEIPNSGDYVLRRLGLDKVIVTRDSELKINVLLNHCRHRGTEVCHNDKGNATSFKCPYHGWVYKNNGDWMGAPHMKDAYGGKLDAKEWGLLRAAKVESIYGFIFASLNEDVPPLREYLGDSAWALDAIFGIHPDGVKLIKEPERFQVKADWKSGAENFCGDAYHVSTAHLSAASSGFIPSVNQVSTHASGYDFGDGNSFIGHNLSEMIGVPLPNWGYPPNIQAQFDLSKLDETQIKMIREIPPTIGTIFPNFSYMRLPHPPAPGAMPIPFTNIRMWQPVAPGVMELWNYEFEFSFVPEEYSELAYAAGQYAFGSGGIFEADDTAVWEGIAKGAQSPWLRKEQVNLHYNQKQLGADPSWTGPGEFHPSIYGEYCQIGFWRRWLKEMREGKQAKVKCLGDTGIGGCDHSQEQGVA